MPVLPIVDLNLATGSSRPALTKTLYDALTTAGFFYLKGVEGIDSDELLKINKWFFNLPEEKKFSITKRMFNSKSDFIYRGYFPLQPTEISHKEGFEMAPPSKSSETVPKSKEERILNEPSQWPQSGNEAEDSYFKERMNFYYSVITKAGIEVMRLIAEAWGLETDTFTPLFVPDHLSTFRLLHYPPRKGDPPPVAISGDKKILLCDEHQDSGFLTIIDTFHYEGLQIRDSENQWLDVPKLEGCLVVNIGKLLATISGGVLKATFHRVIDKGEDRYSCPYFLEPSFHANVNFRLPEVTDTKDQKSNWVKKNVTGKSEDGYGPWLIKRLLQFAEFRELLEFEE